MMKLNEIFDVTYGNKFDLNKMDLSPRAGSGVSFVGRASKNHGVSAVVARVEGVNPFPAGLITVALGGAKLLVSFVQQRPFYTAQNVAVLRPKENLTLGEKVFACLCIQHNRFRYSAFGREANRTLRELPIPSPSTFPAWVKSLESVTTDELVKPRLRGAAVEMNTAGWSKFRLDQLFEIKKGKRLTKAKMTTGTTPFIGAIDKNNGIKTRIVSQPIHEGNTISVSYNGSVAEAFYQPSPYWCSDDVNVLYSKFTMTPELGLFFATLIRLEKYRFNYGRKWHLERMRSSEIRLPVTATGEPDWDFMTSLIGSLRYSGTLGSERR